MSKLSKISKVTLKARAIEAMSEYWKQRCLLAEKIINAPLSEDNKKYEAWMNYNSFIRFYGKTQEEMSNESRE